MIKDSFPKNNSDFTSYLNKAKSEGAEVIFTPVSIAYATQIITQAAKLGIDIPFLGSDTLDDNKVLEAAKGTDVQLYVSTFYQEGGNPEFDEGCLLYTSRLPVRWTSSTSSRCSRSTRSAKPQANSLTCSTGTSSSSPLVPMYSKTA